LLLKSGESGGGGADFIWHINVCTGYASLPMGEFIRGRSFILTIIVL
jgi:hypothetical protein